MRKIQNLTRPPSNALPDIPPTKQPLEFGGIEAVAAHDATIEQQHGNIEAMTALEDRVAVDIDDFDRREGDGAAEDIELTQHLIAKLTVLAMHDCEPWRIGDHREPV